RGVGFAQLANEPCPTGFGICNRWAEAEGALAFVAAAELPSTDRADQIVDVAGDRHWIRATVSIRNRCCADTVSNRPRLRIFIAVCRVGRRTRWGWRGWIGRLGSGVIVRTSAATTAVGALLAATVAASGTRPPTLVSTAGNCERRYRPEHYQ